MGGLTFLTESEFESALERLDARRDAGDRGGARRHGRRALSMPVVLRDEDGWGPVRLEAIDISPAGVLVNTDLHVREGAGYLLEFKSPRSGRAVRVWSRVARRTQAQRQGIAFEFMDLSEQDWDELAGFVSAR